MAFLQHEMSWEQRLELLKVMPGAASTGEASGNWRWFVSRESKEDAL